MGGKKFSSPALTWRETPMAVTRRTARGVLSGLAVSTIIVGTSILGAGSAHAALSAAQLDAVTDTYLFRTTLPRFVTIRGAHPYIPQLDWSSDGCSHVPNSPFGFHFRHACERHDFGYRNYKRQARFTEPHRKQVDDNFRSDMYSVCGTNWECRRTADLYYLGVRKLGGRVASTADAITAVQH
jgi:hypothetical protein